MNFIALKSREDLFWCDWFLFERQCIQIWNSCHTSMSIWYSVIIHEGSNGSPSLRILSSRQHRIAKFKMASIYQCLKLRTKIKWERTTNCMKLKFASSIKRRKGSKIQISGVTMVLYLTSNDFTLCLHLLHLNFIIVNLELIDISVWFSIHSTTLPVIFFLPCSHFYKPFAVLKSFFEEV